VAARRRSARASRWAGTTIERRSRAEDGAPHTLPAHAARSAVSRNSRRVMTTEWSATSTCGRSSVLAAHETPGPNAGWPIAVMRCTKAATGSRADAWTRWYPSREARLRARSWTSRTTLSKRPPRRFRDTNDPPACSDKVCGAPVFCGATILNRGTRLRIHRGRASASSHRGRGTGEQPLQPSVGDRVRATPSGEAPWAAQRPRFPHVRRPRPQDGRPTRGAARRPVGQGAPAPMRRP
jgi:hypothetical protein